MLITLVLVGCLVGVAAATLLATPIYTTQTRLIVSGSSGSGGIDEISRRQLASQRAVAYAQIANTTPARYAAIARATSNGTVFGSGGPAVSAVATGDDPFLVITVKDPDRRRAAAVANSFAAVLPDVMAKLESTPFSAKNELSTVDAAFVPSKPTSPRPIRNGLAGLVAGLVLGVGAGFVREALDRRLRDSDEVERATGVTVLGVVPEELGESRIPVETHPMSSRAEAYRKIRTNLSFTGQHGLPRSILVTSSTSGEGKTTLATNLALACARAGQSVVIVDADLRRPMVAEYLDSPDGIGLTSIITGDVSVSEAIHRLRDTGVDVIPSGPIPANPSELLGSHGMEMLLEQLDATYDIVIVDAPPVLPVADALVLAVMVEAVVLVAKVGNTTRDRLTRAKDAVLKVQGNLVGVVPNAVVQREDSAYAYAYRYRSKRGDTDTLELYTKHARKPELDESKSRLRSQQLPNADTAVDSGSGRPSADDLM